MGRYRRRSAYCVAVVVLVSSIAASVITILPMNAAAVAIHEPIRIDGNDEFTSENGITGGVGTEADPYVLGGWQINPADTPGIYVSNSTVWLVIDRVKVQGGSADGILLESCSNVTISYCVLTGNHVGAKLDRSSNTTIANTECSGNYLGGIRLMCCGGGRDSNISITENVICGNDYGGISCEGLGGTGVSVYRNRIMEDSLGIQIHWLHDSVVFQNAITNLHGGIGIHIACSSNVTVSNNTIECAVLSGVGISLEEGMGGRYVHVLGNNVSNWGTGVFASYDYDTLITDILNNSISGNFRGIYIYGGITTVLGNSFLDNEIRATVEYPPSWTGDQTIVIWNGTYPTGGNYWDDYTGTDQFSGPLQNEPGADSIGDSPLVIDSENTDFYPLMLPVAVVNRPPIAHLDAYPSSGDVTTVFEFDASDSWDDDIYESLDVRWDFEGDGVWDTDWSTETTTDHLFDGPGEYLVIVEVRDSGALADTAQVVVVVMEPIPEFSSQIILICIMIAMIVIVVGLRRPIEKRP